MKNDVPIKKTELLVGPLAVPAGLFRIINAGKGFPRDLNNPTVKYPYTWHFEHRIPLTLS